MTSSTPKNFTEANTAAMNESTTGSMDAMQKLTKAYQELAVRNAHNLTAAMQSMSTVKSPAAFIELQQKLIKEAVDAAMNDSKHIAELTAAVFAAALEPMKKRVEGIQKS